MSCAALARAAGWPNGRRGRTLTTSGVLRPAEAAQACRDLGIELAGAAAAQRARRRGADAGLGDRGGGRFLEIDGRRAWAASDLPDAGSSTHPEPEVILNAWVRAATVVLDLGEEPCAGCLTVLHVLHAADEPLTMEQLASTVGAMLEPADPTGASCPGCGQVHRPGDLLGLATSLAMRMRMRMRRTCGHAADR